MSAAFYGVLNALAKFGEGLAIFFVGGSPILVPLIIAGVVLLIVFNRLKKKKAAIKNNQPPVI
jgi:ABC-type spermidine/putrescine transport system permease subunit II